MISVCQTVAEVVMATTTTPASGSPAVEVARKYILGTHGSLPTPDYEAVGKLLTPDFLFTNEGESHDGPELLGMVFPGWSSIVKGHSEVRILAIADAGNGRVLAHWETDYDVVDEGAVWYGTDVDISGKKVRGFQVFADFQMKQSSDGGGNGDGVLRISRIIQRSDTVVKTMGIEEAVNACRRRMREQEQQQQQKNETGSDNNDKAKSVPDESTK